MGAWRGDGASPPSLPFLSQNLILLQSRGCWRATCWQAQLLALYLGQLPSQTDPLHLHAQEPQKEKHLYPEAGTSPWVFPGWPVAGSLLGMAPGSAPNPTRDSFCSLLLSP